MPEFYVSTSKKEIAWQISMLINAHNKLYRQHSTHTIMAGKTDYFVEIKDGKVVGCVGLLKRFPTMCEIRHVCVAESERRKGIAGKLVNLAIDNCGTELSYMTIRDDNIPSLEMANSLGFVFVKKHWSVDHFVITVGRRKSHGSRVD